MALKSGRQFVISLVGNLATVLTFAFGRFDIKDIFVFGGLSMLWYGLNIYSPAAAYSVCGGILLSVGLVGYVIGGTK
jgi:hypothetical protein